jgi:uncharacterized CHY-type Zn-finger protein
MIIDCSFFKSDCLIFTECCQQYYCCYKCHDEQNDHNLNILDDLSHIKCRQCNTVNELSNKCSQCQIQFNKYYCQKCKFWTKEPKSFHCDDCNMCYVGKREKYIHCYSCNICIPRSKLHIHNCKISNDKDNDCPLCLENLYKLKRDNVLLPCGHTIHKKCFYLYKETITDKKKLKCLFCFRFIEELNEEVKQKQSNPPVPSAPPLPS